MTDIEYAQFLGRFKALTEMFVQDIESFNRIDDDIYKDVIMDRIKIVVRQARETIDDYNSRN